MTGAEFQTETLPAEEIVALTGLLSRERKPCHCCIERAEQAQHATSVNFITTPIVLTVDNALDSTITTVVDKGSGILYFVYACKFF